MGRPACVSHRSQEYNPLRCGEPFNGDRHASAAPLAGGPWFPARFASVPWSHVGQGASCAKLTDDF